MMNIKTIVTIGLTITVFTTSAQANDRTWKTRIANLEAKVTALVSEIEALKNNDNSSAENEAVRLVDSTGKTVGRHMHDGWTLITTDKGNFIATFGMEGSINGTTNRLFYDNSTCSGTGLFRAGSNSPYELQGTWIDRSTMRVLGPDQTASPTTTAIQSYRDTWSGSCSGISFSEKTVPAVEVVDLDIYSSPLRYE